MDLNLKKIRTELNLNQTEMAKAMGVDRRLWLKWERKEQGITAAPTRLLGTLLWLNQNNMLSDFLRHFKVKKIRQK
jgi:transcriptional regulator with XRE-family HTH domain